MNELPRITPRPPITEVLKRVTEQEKSEAHTNAVAQEAADKQRPKVDDLAKQHTNTIRAGVLNLLDIRKDHLQRVHFTPADMQRFDIAVGALLREAAVEEKTDAEPRIAPQSQEPEARDAGLDAVEAALRAHDPA